MKVTSMIPLASSIHPEEAMPQHSLTLRLIATGQPYRDVTFLHVRPEREQPLLEGLEQQKCLITTLSAELMSSICLSSFQEWACLQLVLPTNERKEKIS